MPTHRDIQAEIEQYGLLRSALRAIEASSPDASAFGLEASFPMLVSYQLRSKAAEGAIDVAAIQKAVEAHYAEYSVYVSARPATPAAVGPTKQPWGVAPGDPHGFNSVGYVPESQVYYQYGVTSDGSTAYTIGGRSDIDADGAYNTWGYVKPSGDTGAGVVGPFMTCAATGVLDPVSLVPNCLNLVGPCDLASSGNVY
jgi:hypothetical protein